MRRSNGLVLIIVASVMLAGCHLGGDRQQSIQRWSGLLSDLRYQWDAAPGIDVEKGVAVVVRAYLESWFLAQSMGSLDYAYPGFDRAVQGSDHDTNIRPNVNYSLTKALIGNARHHILSLVPGNDGVVGTVCNYDYFVATEVGDGKYESVARRPDSRPQGIHVERIVLAAGGNRSEHLPPQAGPSPAASQDVFGSWRITGHLFVTGGSEFRSQWPTFDDDLAK
ncbi:hypothetical protein [Mycolicibacterium brisbanense]|uniref:hypothetical protein n=1 Tax=Mycolicibacterium brisbanense TaxID=146020 RepID=UPI000B116250|nr:hypothetical protein [Mycolicibacterium brisbanense]MCV7160537.1 hypothetical protein [Mycolicibacterium brisbanense]